MLIIYDDTILCTIDGKNTKIRLIGIDTEEMEINGNENIEEVLTREFMVELLTEKCLSST